MPKIMHPKEIREKARMLTLQGLKPMAVSIRLNVPHYTVRQWVARYEWNHQATQKLQMELAEAKLNAQADSPTLISDRARNRLAIALLRQAEWLAKQSVTGAKLRDSHGVKGLASTTKTVAESCALVFGWKSDTTPASLIVVGDMAGTCPLDEPTDETTSLRESCSPSDSESTPDSEYQTPAQWGGRLPPRTESGSEPGEPGTDRQPTASSPKESSQPE